MPTIKRNNVMVIVSWIAALVVIIVVFAIWQVTLLNKAHSTFENYYNFRGCTQLLDKTDVSGTCLTKSGEAIKIVKFNDKWYLDGDLPCGFLCF